MIDATEKAYREKAKRRLAQIRMDLGLSQPEMARRLGMGADAYIKSEHRGSLRMFYLARLVAKFGIDPRYLLTGEWAPRNRDEHTPPAHNRESA